MFIEFCINGRYFQTKNTFTISDLVIYLNLINYPIAIELNEIFISKEQWRTLELKNFDQIEIVTIVGGG